MLTAKGDQVKALFHLKRALETIPEVGDKKSLVLLRDLIYLLDWKLPIEKLSIPVDTHVALVMYRTGLSASENVQDVKMAAERLFRIPVYADIVLWRIGKWWCFADRPCCRGCVLNDLCPKIGVE